VVVAHPQLVIARQNLELCQGAAAAGQQRGQPRHAAQDLPWRYPAGHQVRQAASRGNFLKVEVGQAVDAPRGHNQAQPLPAAHLVHRNSQDLADHGRRVLAAQLGLRVGQAQKAQPFRFGHNPQRAALVNQSLGLNKLNRRLAVVLQGPALFPNHQHGRLAADVFRRSTPQAGHVLVGRAVRHRRQHAGERQVLARKRPGGLGASRLRRRRGFVFHARQPVRPPTSQPRRHVAPARLTCTSRAGAESRPSLTLPCRAG